MTNVDDVAKLAEEVTELKRQVGQHRNAFAMLPLVAVFLYWVSVLDRDGSLRVDDSIQVGNAGPSAIVTPEHLTMRGQDKRLTLDAVDGISFQKGPAYFRIYILNGQLVVSGSDGNGNHSDKPILGGSTSSVEDQISIGDDVVFDNSQ